MILKKKIAHISTVHIRTDTRILFKEVKSLSKKYDTTLIVADGKGNSTKNGFSTIIDLGIPKNRFYRILFFGIKSYSLIKNKNFESVHIHDPELILIGFLFKIKGLKVIYDIHELVYEDLRTKNWIKFQFFKNIVAGLYLLLERLAFKYFDGIILAEDGYKDFYEKNYSNYINKISYVRNYPIKSMFNNKDSNKTDKKKANSIIYLGAISKDRGIIELISSMNLLDSSFNLYIIGKWPKSNLLEECKKLSGWSKVQMLGYLSPDKIGDYINKSRIGICTLYRLKNFAYTTPVKSFEYLINGLPMIMTDFPFWNEFYAGTALFVDPYNPKDISKAIKQLFSDDDLYQNMSKKGYELALNHCWENEEKKLIELYKNII